MIELDIKEVLKHGKHLKHFSRNKLSLIQHQKLLLFESTVATQPEKIEEVNA